MMLYQTMEQLAEMKLSGLLAGLREQIEGNDYAELSFEERLALLVDKEYLLRDNRRLTKKLQEARLKVRAQIEDVDFQSPRGLDKKHFLELASGNWLTRKHNLIMTGPTGSGKTYLACALTEKACRSGFRCLYMHFPDLVREMTVARAEGTLQTLVRRWEKRDLLVIDDWLREPLTAEQARCMIDLMDNRFRSKSTLLASQIPVGDWHARFQDPTLADAVLDRIVHDSHRIELQGDSMRKRTSSLTKRAS
ncbi:IS21-like element helper ATPase IstB [Desulfarculus baarsii]